MKHKPLVLFIGAVLFFAACKKDSDSPVKSEPPVTEPLTVAAAKPGDTVIIKGSNFSEFDNENNVEFNGVGGSIEAATATEIKVIVPAKATTGLVTVTVNGVKTEVGTLIIVPYTLFCIKGNFQQTPSLRQLIALNPETGAETLVATINQTGDKVEDAIYLPATNEVIGRDYYAENLIKINVTTKQVTKVPLPATATTGFIELVVDKNSELYAVKLNVANQNHIMQTLVKLNPKTGAATDIKSFELNDEWESLVYLPENNEVVGLTAGGTKLLKLNLTTKDTSTVALANTTAVQYRELLTDNVSNLYGYKADYSDPVNYVAQIQKLNAKTGAETLVSGLQIDKLDDNLIYNPLRKEIVSVSDENIFYRLSIDGKAAASFPFADQGSVYSTLISN
ncbi:MAG TPA: IPT/TIG domain-containing protein [Niastella sp.]